jgi:hypothetical protein
MKASLNIVFHYREDRLKFINRIIETARTYPFETAIYVHTNIPLPVNLPINGNPVHGNLEHPFMLPQKTKLWMANHKLDFDTFIFIEDDILITLDAINYWLKYKWLVGKRFNPGFLRIELDSNKTEFLTDINFKIPQNLISISGEEFIINGINPYCACWIYELKEFNNYMASKWWIYKREDKCDYDLRAREAAGNIKNYYATLIPWKNGGIDKDCRIYHMANNYVGKNIGGFAQFQLHNAVEK